MLILNFESGTRFQDFRKYNQHFGLFSTPFSLEINFLLANFLIECSSLEQQLDTYLKEKLNIVSLLEIYIKYLARKKYKQILIHNITFCKYIGMYSHNEELLFLMFFISSVKLHLLCIFNIIMFHLKPTPLSLSKKKYFQA